MRRRIDALDERIVELLNERASCALRIGEMKQQLGLEIYQPERESQVLSHVREHGVATGGPLGGEALAEKAGIDPTARPEDLTIEQFAALARASVEKT